MNARKLELTKSLEAAKSKVKLFPIPRPKPDALWARNPVVGNSISSQLLEHSHPMQSHQLRRIWNNFQVSRVNLEDCSASINTLWFKWWRRENQSPYEPDLQASSRWKDETSPTTWTTSVTILILQTLPILGTIRWTSLSRFMYPRIQSNWNQKPRNTFNTRLARSLAEYTSSSLKRSTLNKVTIENLK